MFQNLFRWLKNGMVMGLGLGFIAALPSLVFVWNSHCDDIPRYNAMEAVICQRLDDRGRYPEAIAKRMNSSPYVDHLFGHPAFVDIGPLESPGNEPGVCYYQTSEDRRTYKLYVNDRNGKQVKVWTMHSPIP